MSATFEPNPAGLAAVVGEIVEDAAKFCAKTTRDNLRSMGAVRTGKLLRGVKVSPPDASGSSISREVYNEVFYASFVEFGNGPGTAPVPAMEQARATTERRYT